MTETAAAPEYHYAETYSCGHFLEVVAFVKVESDDRIGKHSVCPLCRYKLDRPDFIVTVTGFEALDKDDWQGSASTCPDGRCGPIEDASDYPDAFPMLGDVDIEPYQLGRCVRCGIYYRWNISRQGWEPWQPIPTPTI